VNDFFTLNVEKKQPSNSVVSFLDIVHFVFVVLRVTNLGLDVVVTIVQCVGLVDVTSVLKIRSGVFVD
jgi:hypothetical protein